MIVTSVDVAVAMTKLVAVGAAEMIAENLTTAGLADRFFESDFCQAGDMTNARVTLAKQAEATFVVPDVAKVLAVPDLLPLYMRPAVSSLVDKTELDLLALATSLPAIVAADGAGIARSIDLAEAKLRDEGVAESADKYLVVDLATYARLREEKDFDEYSSATEAGLYRRPVAGKIGKIGNCYVVGSRLCQKTRSLYFAEGAIGLVSGRIPSPVPGSGYVSAYARVKDIGFLVTTPYSPSGVTQQYTIQVLYGVGLLVPGHAVRLS